MTRQTLSDAVSDTVRQGAPMKTLGAVLVLLTVGVAAVLVTIGARAVDTELDAWRALRPRREEPPLWIG
jgi:hypothetical protein